MAYSLEQTTVQPDYQPNRDLRGSLLRRKWLIVCCVVASVLVGLAACVLVRPVYQRTVRILVEGKSHSSGQTPANDPLNIVFAPGSAHEVDTQIEILKSDAIQAAACAAAGVPPGLVLDPIHPSIHVDVKQVNVTDIIEVVISGRDPRPVENLARTMADVYLNYVVDNHKAEITRALSFAREHKEDEKSKLRAAEIALQKFKVKTRIANLDTERNNRIIEAINSDERKRRAEQNAAASAARYQAVLAARHALPGEIDTKASTSNTQQIQSYKERIAGLETERSNLAFYYKPGSPEILRIDRQLSALNDQLARLPATVTTLSRAPNPSISPYNDRVAEARAALTVAKSELTTSRTDAASLANDLQKYGPLERQQAELVRDVDEHRNAFNLLANGVSTLSLQEKGTRIPVQVLSGDTAARQVEPRPVLYLGLSLLFGVILGCLTALGLASVDTRLHTVESFLKATGGAVLAYVPSIKGRDNYVISRNCNGALIESYLRLRSAILFAGTRNWMDTIAVVSTIPGEGKSTTALNLAATMAADGRRVILVDGDIHWPTLHKILGLEAGPGLTDVLKGEITLDAALQETPVAGLQLLSAGSLSVSPAEIFDTGSMRTLNTTLKERADMVIYDTPACLACVDASILASLADGVVYVAELGKVTQEAFSDSLDILWQANANILGYVFNKVDPGSSRGVSHFGYRRYHTRRPLALLPPDDTGRADLPPYDPPVSATVTSDTREVTRR